MYIYIYMLYNCVCSGMPVMHVHRCVHVRAYLVCVCAKECVCMRTHVPMHFRTHDVANWRTRATC